MSMGGTWPVVLILLLPVVAGCDQDSADTGIAVNEASSAGLMRTDAVTVEGPESVDTNGGPTSFAVRVRVAPAQGRQTVDADFTGSCTLAGTTHPRGIPVNANSSARATVTVSVPAAADSCDLVVDAWVTGRTYTGNDLRTTFHR
jgi:hypothetical protein